MLELAEQHTGREEVKEEEEVDIEPILDKNNDSEDLQAVEIDTHFKLKKVEDEEQNGPKSVRGFALDQEKLESSSGSKSEIVEAGTGAPSFLQKESDP